MWVFGHLVLLCGMEKKIKTCKVCKVSTFQNILTSGVVFVVQNFICHNL